MNARPRPAKMPSRHSSRCVGVIGPAAVQTCRLPPEHAACANHAVLTPDALNERQIAVAEGLPFGCVAVGGRHVLHEVVRRGVFLADRDRCQPAD